MDAQQAVLLATVDPAVLGQRLRAARQATGMTQADLAGKDVSTGYVSRIESGQRRPNSKVLTELAVRLGIGLEQLLGGVSSSEYDEIRLSLDFAELSLESGEPVEARDRAAEAIERSESAVLGALAERAHYLHARALESLGQMDSAILEFEAMLAQKNLTLLRIKAGIALTRAYRDSGDLSDAIECGQRLLDELTGSKLEQSDETVQLAVTLASAYFERGDTGHAIRICRTAVMKAEVLGSPAARASAYWNASIMESGRGEIDAAIPLAERALALLSEGQDTRNLARLRTQLASMQLSEDPPAIDAARVNLDQAASEFVWSSASQGDLARNEVTRARVHLLDGDPHTAAEMSASVYASALESSPLIAADAKSVEGQALAALGDTEAATVAYRRAVEVLTSLGSDRGAAQLWFDLAGQLDEIGETVAARDAYRSAAASTGLRLRTTRAVRSRERA